VFRCESCAAEAHDLVEKGVIKVPTQCAGCGAKQTMRLIPNRSAFMNRQVMHGGWSTCAQVDAGVQLVQLSLLTLPAIIPRN
jgi:uncharacterized Zn finger protein